MGRRIGPNELSILATRLGETLKDAGLPSAITVRKTEKTVEEKTVDLFDPAREQEYMLRFHFLSSPKHWRNRVDR